ncbi:FtsX-like permease family protein [Ornithinimicrobium pratense]|uniref:FtsX-like permease family protein n=1 Tax=Ornithinimicrobium pratense TaxID=2593973 RepID=A0A5J6V9G8_9MICO|nr:FtsX-like permease family protein [Ornithinimicrobium pratense]QFG69811.1 FtsX-like permease family protein [Ornithinimicrobium pratense]
MPTGAPTGSGPQGTGPHGSSAENSRPGRSSRASAAWMTAGLAARGRRLISAAIAIIIGTAFLATSLIVVATAQRGLEDAVATGVRDADLVVEMENSWLTIEQYDAVAAVDGVAQVSGDASTYAERGSQYFPGVSVPAAGARLLEGASPTAAGEIAVNPMAADHGVAIGDTLTVTGSEDEDGVANDMEATVVGIIDPGELSQLSYGEGFMATDATLRELDPQLGYNYAQVELAEGADQDTVRTALALAVPEAQVRTGPEAAEARVAGLTGETAVLGAILLGFGAVALATAAIVIANTFTITLAQRTGELALLRCIGAAKTQVRRMVLLEALLLGVLASAVGVLVGLGAAWGLLAFARTLDMGIPLGSGLAVTALAVVLPLAVGTAVTVLASLQPATRATRVSPLAALRPTDTAGKGRRAGWVRLALAALLAGVGLAAMLYAATNRNMLAGVGGGLISFLGVLLAAVVIVPLAVRALGVVARRTGVPGRLAVDNAVRNPGRAAATSAALLVGVTLITMTTIGAATGERTALGEIDDAYTVDLALVASPGTDEDEQPVPAQIPQGVEGRVRALEGVADTSLVPTAQLTLGQDWPVQALGLDEQDGGVFRSASQLATLEPGTVGLSEGLQSMYGLEGGDRLEVSGTGGSQEMTVVEVGLGYNVALHKQDLLVLGGDQVGEGTLLIRAGDDADLGALLTGIQDLGEDTLYYEGSAVERAVITQVLDVLVLVTTALLGVAVIIAVVGIANTLSLSVVERQREHALLRGLGLTRGQMRSMLLTEGVLLAVVSAVLGLGLGLLYAWLGVQTVLPEGTNVRLGIPWARLGLILGVALLAGLLASVLPARRAARVTPAEGLATA